MMKLANVGSVPVSTVLAEKHPHLLCFLRQKLPIGVFVANIYGTLDRFGSRSARTRYEAQTRHVLFRPADIGKQPLKETRSVSLSRVVMNDDAAPCGGVHVWMVCTTAWIGNPAIHLQCGDEIIGKRPVITVSTSS